MPAGCHPFPAHRDGDQVVQLQSKDRGSATRGPPVEPRAVITPGKMLGPPLATWVKEADPLAGLRIQPLRLRGLEIVAQAAPQPKVVLFIGPALGFGNDVVDFQPAQNESLRTQAIAAPIPSLSPHAYPDFLGNTAGAHD